MVGGRIPQPRGCGVRPSARLWDPPPTTKPSLTPSLLLRLLLMPVAMRLFGSAGVPHNEVRVAFSEGTSGSSMTSKPVAFLLADLGVTKTHSRPYTSTDNPYSEAQFKTLKYRPGFPARFDSIEHARAFCREFFGWYNHQHRHSGIGLMTPATVHHVQAEQTHAARRAVLEAAYAATPERFLRRPPRPPALPTGA